MCASTVIFKGFYVRNILYLLLLFFLPAHAVDNIYSDSYAHGVGASNPPVTGFVPLLQVATGHTFNNQAIDGGMAADMSVKAHGVTQGAADWEIVQLGANEQHVYLGDATKQGYFRAFMLDIVMSGAAPSWTPATGMTASTYSSGSWTTWTTTAPYAGAMQSWLGGSSLTGQFTGTALYVSVQLSEPAGGSALAGTANVLVDGTVVGTVTSNGTGMSTGQGTTAAPATYRFGGLSAGLHTAQIVMTSDVHSIAGLLRVIGIAGSGQTVKPRVVVGNIPKWTAAAYAQYGGSDAIVLQYVTITNTIVQQAQTDGLNVLGVDNYTALNPAVNMLDLHPNDSVYALIEQGYYAQFISGTPPVVYVPAYLCTNGTNYFGAADVGCTINLQPL